MEQVSIRDYIDQRLDSLEQHIDSRFDRLEGRFVTWRGLVTTLIAVGSLVAVFVNLL